MTLPVRVTDHFLERVAETGNVSRVCAELGLVRMTMYERRYRDPDFARLWDMALEVARGGLKERVVETACAMGLGRMVPVLDDDGRPVLDDDFEPVMRMDTSGVDARVLMKLMDKTMRDEARTVDQRMLVAGRVEHDHTGDVALVVYSPDGEVLDLREAEDAERLG